MRQLASKGDLSRGGGAAGLTGDLSSDRATATPTPAVLVSRAHLRGSGTAFPVGERAVRAVLWGTGITLTRLVGGGAVPTPRRI